MEVVVSRCSGSFRCSDQVFEPPGVAERACHRCLLNPCDPCPLQLVKVQLVDLMQQRHHNLAPSQLDREPGSPEQATPAGSSLAEVRDASQGGYRYRDRTSLLCPGCCLFEFERNLLMLAGEQRRAVPCPAVGLIGQHIRQCLMHTLEVPHA